MIINDRSIHGVIIMSVLLWSDVKLSQKLVASSHTAFFHRVISQPDFRRTIRQPDSRPAIILPAQNSTFTPCLHHQS
jgi:hypothetical protein